MRRAAFASAAFVATAIFAPFAWSHGGTFRDPGGAVPPPLREPGDPDPTPPPPPGPTSGGVPCPPENPPPPPAGAPTSPPPPRPAVTPGSETPRGRAAGYGYENWTFWWGRNADPILRLKPS